MLANRAPDIAPGYRPVFVAAIDIALNHSLEAAKWCNAIHELPKLPTVRPEEMWPVGMYGNPALVPMVMNVAANVRAPVQYQNLPTCVGKRARYHAPGDARTNDQIIDQFHNLARVRAAAAKTSKSS